MKPRLLVLELWGLGDLAIATPFLQAASETFAVTLLAKPFAAELQPRFWPAVEVIPFTAPWTAFQKKYRLWRWPWGDLSRLRNQVTRQEFDFGVSARWDPRDHLLLKLVGARERLGFPRLNSQRFLTRALPRPQPLAHRYEAWRTIGQALGLKLPERGEYSPNPDARITPRSRSNSGAGFQPASFGQAGSLPHYPVHGKVAGTPESPSTAASPSPLVLLHSGAKLPVRVWPLEHFRDLAARLRNAGFKVQIACDPEQADWWRQHGEKPACPGTVTELLALLDGIGVFIGNDSGPGHLAAACGRPTFTIFGPQLPEWFAPLHPAAEVIEGKACPYKPCADHCRFPEPFCIRGITPDEVWPRVEAFARRNLKLEARS